MALNIGSRIAHYDVTALIGEGSMGEVYRARDTAWGEVSSRDAVRLRLPWVAVIP